MVWPPRAAAARAIRWCCRAARRAARLPDATDDDISPDFVPDADDEEEANAEEADADDEMRDDAAKEVCTSLGAHAGMHADAGPLPL